MRTYTEYQEEQKNHPKWPSNPQSFYPEWKSWPDFFGREKKSLLNLAALKIEVQDAGVDTPDQYRRAKKNHPTWPSHPDRYPGWISWHDLFGKKNK